MLYDSDNKQQAIFGMLARFGEAMSSPKRLKIISLLSEGPKSVEQLADMTNQSVAAASALLRDCSQWYEFAQGSWDRCLPSSLRNPGMESRWSATRIRPQGARPKLN